MWSGSPSAPSKPSVKQQDRSLLLQWVDGATGDSPIYGYLIQNKKKEQGRTPWTVFSCGSISQSVLTVVKCSRHECIMILDMTLWLGFWYGSSASCWWKEIILCFCLMTVFVVVVFCFLGKHNLFLSRPNELCCNGVALHTQSNNRNIGKLYYSE